MPKAPELTLTKLEQEYRSYQKQKAPGTGGVEARTLVNIAQYAGETHVYHRSGQLKTAKADPNQPQLPINLMALRWRKLRGRLCAVNGQYKAKPDGRDPKKIALSEMVDKLTLALDEKLGEATLNPQRLDWAALGGVAFSHVTFRPDEVVEPTVVFVEDEESEFFGQALYQDTVTQQLVPEGLMQQVLQTPDPQTGQMPPQSRFEPYEELDLTGDVHEEILGPLNVFLPESVSSIKDLAPDQSVMVAKVRTIEWIRKNWPDVKGIDKLVSDDEIKIVSTGFTHVGDSLSGTNIQHLIPVVQGRRGPDDPEMAVVVERYQPVSSLHPRGWDKSAKQEGFGGRYTCFVPGQMILNDGELPYADGIPLVDFHWESPNTTFWNKGYFEDLIPLAKFIRKRIEQAAMYANAWIMNPVLLGPGVTKDDWPTDKPGFIEGGLSDQGQPLAQRMQPAGIGGWFNTMLDQAKQMFDDLAGGADLFRESKFPGQLRGPMAVPMLQEILDTEWGPLMQHWGERLAMVKQMRMNRVKQFYPPVRVLHYASKTQKDEVLVFNTSEVLRSDTDFNITIDRSTLVPEIRALREARIIERLASPLQGLYMDRRTGQLDWGKIAADLSFGDTGREERQAQSRKLQLQENDMMWKGQQVPVSPWNDHVQHLDEIEAVLETTEFLQADQQVQQLFVQHWQQHNQILQQMAQQQAQAQQQQGINAAVAQATQQAAARAANETVDAVLDQLRAFAQQPGSPAMQAVQQDQMMRQQMAQQQMAQQPPRGM